MSDKSSNLCFVLELPLTIDSAGAKRLERDFEFGRQLWNATLGEVLKRRSMMCASEEWSEACAMPKGAKRTAAFKALSKDYGISGASDFEKILLNHSIKSGRKTQINSDIKQVIADNLWRAYSRWVFEDGGRPRFKGKGHGLHSIRGKKNSTGITWKPETETVRYGGVSYKVVIDSHDDYAS